MRYESIHPLESKQNAHQIPHVPRYLQRRRIPVVSHERPERSSDHAVIMKQRIRAVRGDCGIDVPEHRGTEGGE